MAPPTTPPDTSARTRGRGLGVLAVVGLVTVAAALLSALATGAVAPRVLLDPGAAVRWGAPVVGVLRNLALAVTLGGLALLALVLPPPARVLPGARRAAARPPDPTIPALHVPPAPDAAAGIAPRFQLTHAPHHRAHASRPGDGRAWERTRRISAVAAVVWAVTHAVDVLLTHLAVAGSSIGDPTYGTQLWQFLTEIELGQILGLSVLFAAAAAAATVAVGGLTSAGWALAATAIALVPVALTGHAAGAAAHDLAVSGLYLHLLGVSVWAGGLVVLTLVAPLLRGLPADTADTARRFSSVAGWCVVLVVVSGFASAYVRLDSPADLVTHPYGRVLLAKILLTIVLMAAGAWHRRHLLGRLDAAGGEAMAARTARSVFWRLVGAEALVIGAVVGLAVTMSSSAPPVPQEPPAAPSPVFDITGYPEPPSPEVLNYLTQWYPDPLIATACGAALVLYLRWRRRLVRRGDRWSTPRTVAWVAGVVVLFWVTQGGPAVYGRVLFSAHMFEHMMLAMVIPILLVLGAPVTLALRALPQRRDGSRGGREWLLALVGSRWAQFFAHPIVAAVNFAGSLIVFYYTAFLPLALETHPGHILMVAHFTLAGYLFVNALIGIDPGPQRPPHALRIVLLFGTMAFHAFFGVSITSLTTLLAPEYFGLLGLSWGVDALADQVTGGMITWGIGEIPTLALAVSVGFMWATDDARVARREDRRADRDGDAELAAYNEMLARRAGEAPEPAPAGGDARR